MMPRTEINLRRCLTYLQFGGRVSLGYFYLDLQAKMGYPIHMLRSILFLVLRFFLIVAIWAFLWRYLEPKTQLMRIMRAALLLLCLLGVMAVVKLTGP